MKIITVTDAWHPQINGVVRTIEATNRELERTGHSVEVIAPSSFTSMPCPGYREIRLSLAPFRRLRHLLDAALDTAEEAAVHIATEGPLGHAARRYCMDRGIHFTTAYHTRFPQYLHAMFRVPERWTYAFLRRFHGPAARVMAPTSTVERELRANGLHNVALWTRGVDTDMFRPMPPSLEHGKGPTFLYVGRVSVEKNIQAFLDLDLPGTKVVAGVGPALQTLKQRFPEVQFAGVLDAESLARLYSSADVFVFPSRTDTFGLVMLEALACGTPVAAFPVQGPIDVVGGSAVAVLDDDLRKAALQALRLDRAACRSHAERYSWRAATAQFTALQVVIHPRALRADIKTAPAVS
jgi:glycosyltransferase involved in cell wall biosynthesis